MDTEKFWADAAAIVRNVAARVRLNPRYIGGDAGQVKEDMMQEGLMGAASWLGAHADFVERSDPNDCRRVFNPVIKRAMFNYLKQVNRENGHELSASDWYENAEAEAIVEIEHEQDMEEKAQDTLDEIIESNENNTLKASITCLDREMQAIVLLHNDGFSFTLIAKRMNFSRERPRQLYHKAMRELKAAVAGEVVTHELPLKSGAKEQETLLFSSQEEKLRELRFRPRSPQGNISNATRAMRAMQQAGKNAGQMSLF